MNVFRVFFACLKPVTCDCRLLKAFDLSLKLSFYSLLVILYDWYNYDFDIHCFCIVLLAAFSMWLPQSIHDSLLEIWPPIQDGD